MNVEDYDYLAKLMVPRPHQALSQLCHCSSLSLRQKEKVSENDEQSGEADFKWLFPFICPENNYITHWEKKEAKVMVSLKFHWSK